MTYIQARLERNGISITKWIPIHLAVLGKVIDIRMNGEWSNGWTVVEII